MATVSISGVIRINDGTANVFTKNFFNSVVISQFVTRDIVFEDGFSDVILSLAEMSSPSVFMAVNNATSALRVNFANHASADSAASLGYEFTGIYMVTGSNISGSLATHWSNSSGDSAVATVILAM
jgi:hypothetical protein